MEPKNFLPVLREARSQAFEPEALAAAVDFYHGN